MPLPSVPRRGRGRGRRRPPGRAPRRRDRPLPGVFGHPGELAGDPDRRRQRSPSVARSTPRPTPGSRGWPAACSPGRRRRTPTPSGSRPTSAAASRYDRVTARLARPARRLPAAHQARLLPALLRRHGAAAAPRRRAGAGGGRVRPGRLAATRARASGSSSDLDAHCVGRGVVPRHRLGHVRPHAGGSPPPVARRRRTARRSRRSPGSRAPSSTRTSPRRRRRGAPRARLARGRPAAPGRAHPPRPGSSYSARRPCRPRPAIRGRLSARSGGAFAELDGAAELERALRRAGRPLAGGTTLRQLEARLAGAGDAAAYVRAVRARRYNGAAAGPTPAERRGLRRELARGLGLVGVLRAWWALPPRTGSVLRG